MKNVNWATLVVTVAVMGVAGYLHVTGQPQPAIITALVGVIVNSLLPQLVSKAKVTVQIGSDPPPKHDCPKTPPAPPPDMGA